MSSDSSAERTFLASFVKLINVKRKEKNLTQEQPAGLSNMDIRHVQKLLAGEIDPRLTTVVAIANALDIDLSKFLDRASNDPSKFSFTDVERPSVSDMLGFTRNNDSLYEAHLNPEGLCNAISYAHSVIDSIDLRLEEAGVEKLGGGMVELANYSSMIGNLLAAGVAKFSGGKYRQNGPHKYPDLIACESDMPLGIEIKMGLENNKPKGHLAKPGLYLTFRYVLTKRGVFIKGKENRGDTAFIWESRLGYLSVDDFSISNTDGDSGKTAVIKTDSLKNMDLVYFDQSKCPISKYGSYLN